jgi:hypothetical protein
MDATLSSPRLISVGLIALVPLALVAPEARAQGTQAPPVVVTQTSAATAPGFIFLTPYPISKLPADEVSTICPEIVDGLGRPVWFLPQASGVDSDLRVQTYQGHPVLTWSEGPTFQYEVPGTTTDYICDNTYKVIATVQAGNGLNADEHEFVLTPQGTALITIYNNVAADLSSVGGPSNGVAEEGVVQEIDVATGNVLFEWHSLDHVPLTDSYADLPASGAYDYFHINSVNPDTDGNLLISSRHTWTVYKVDRTTGNVIWRLGGKRSDFTLGPGVPFAWQHDAIAVDSSTIRIFDNESNGVPVLPASRVIWVKHDDVAMTATLSQEFHHPQGLQALAEGNAQALPNGDTFVGWGIIGRFSEFDSGGNLVFDAALPAGYNDYRAYRQPWVASPTTLPTSLSHYNADGTTTVDAIWNGATEVASWQVFGGNDPSSLGLVGQGDWNGLDTAIVVPGLLPYCQVSAVNAAGSVLGTSTAAATSPAFIAQPASQVIADGATVVFRADATGPLPKSFQWFLDGVPLSDGVFGGTTLSGSSGPKLVIGGATPASAGTYTCSVTTGGSTTTSDGAILTVSETQDVGRLINVSCRAQVGTGDNVLIAGYVVGGQDVSGTENLLIRASGPALAAFNVTGLLPDPELVLTLVSSETPKSRTLSGWDGSTLVSGTAAAVGAFAWTDPNSLDSADVHAFHIGAHTAEIKGASGDTGVALDEIYDATPAGTYTPSTPHLVNISARGQVGTGSNVLIAGFVIGGSTSKTMLIRAAGSSLAQFGVSGTLLQADLQLRSTLSGDTVLAENIGWGGDPQIAAAAQAAGAFAWTDPSNLDSAILITLAPGAYTAEVSGVNGETGIALVEVYEVQ